jgi:hypothetical protein
MDMVKPFALKQGDKIGIVVPSMPITDEKAVKNGIETLQALGFGFERGFTWNYWLHGYYENEYIKENGKWLFSKLHWNNTFWTPYEDGWLKTPLLGTMSEHPTIKADAPPTAFHPYPSGFHLPYSFRHPVTGGK